MQGLQATSAPAEPFALGDQYVKAIEKARAEAADGQTSEEEEDGAPAAEPAKPDEADAEDNGDANAAPGPVETTKKSKKKKTDWDYSNIKSAFMEKQKDAGYTFQKAKELWDNSNEKASYLGQVSVAELKKRRFIGKDDMSNPWRKALDGDQ